MLSVSRQRVCSNHAMGQASNRGKKTHHSHDGLQPGKPLLQNGEDSLGGHFWSNFRCSCPNVRMLSFSRGYHSTHRPTPVASSRPGCFSLWGRPGLGMPGMGKSGPPPATYVPYAGRAPNGSQRSPTRTNIQPVPIPTTPGFGARLLQVYKYNIETG